MAAHPVITAVILGDYAFWWGATLVFCGFGGASEEASAPESAAAMAWLKAVAAGILIVVMGVVAIAATGKASQTIHFALPPALLMAPFGVWTGLRTWRSILLGMPRNR